MPGEHMLEALRACLIISMGNHMRQHPVHDRGLWRSICQVKRRRVMSWWEFASVLRDVASDDSSTSEAEDKIPVN
jgi:hypothetical protein